MGTLGFERGVSTLANQIGFERELEHVIAAARANGAAADLRTRQRLASAWIGLRVMRFNALRTLTAVEPGPEASVSKLQWASWHRALGELAVDVRGMSATVVEGASYGLDDVQRLFLFTRADTIYGGSNQIQRNIIGERALGLPREP